MINGKHIFCRLDAGHSLPMEVTFGLKIQQGEMLSTPSLFFVTHRGWVILAERRLGSVLAPSLLTFVALVGVAASLLLPCLALTGMVGPSSFTSFFLTFLGLLGFLPGFCFCAVLFDSVFLSSTELTVLALERLLLVLPALSSYPESEFCSNASFLFSSCFVTFLFLTTLFLEFFSA